MLLALSTNPTSEEEEEQKRDPFKIPDFTGDKQFPGYDSSLFENRNFKNLIDPK